MDGIVFWVLLAVFTAFTGALLAKYLGHSSALAIMALALLVGWITGFSIEGFFESVSDTFLKVGQQLIVFIVSLF
jgi:hypothetical protein